MAGGKTMTSSNRDVTEDQKTRSTNILTSVWLTSAIVFSVAVLCFANSYDGEFVFDDAEAVQNNKDLLPTTPLADLLYHDFWGRKLSNLSHKSYRPLTVLTFRWSYWFAGGLHPEGFHIVNIILHGFVSVLSLPVFSLFLSSTANHNGQWMSSVSKWSFFCSLLFAVHPVHTESVAGIVGRADLLCALFFILSFLFYVRGCTAYSSYRPGEFSLTWLGMSLLCCGLATFSKEQGITVIGICSAYDILSVCGIDVGALFGMSHFRPSASSFPSKSASVSEKELNGSSTSNGHHSTSTKWQLSLIKRQVILTALAVFLLVVRWRVMGSAPPTFQIHDNPHAFVNGTLFRALNYNYLYAVNAWILLAPQWLCFDWSMGCVPTISSLTDPRLAAVAALWIALALLAWTCLCSGNASIRRSLTLAVALTVVPYLPATNLMFVVGFVVAERVLYLPSAGFCLLVIIGLRQLCHKHNWKYVVTILFLVFVTVFIVRSIQRSNDWREGMRLYKAGERICPNNAKIHYNIGKLNGDAGNADLAVERYKHAIELNPVYDQAMNNLANLLKDQGKPNEAEMWLDKAVSVNPDFAAAWMNRGIVKAALKKYEEAENSYREALRCRKNYPDCYYNLGNLYLDMERSQDALTAFYNATLLRPTHWNAWNNAIIHLDELGRYQQAVDLAHTALKHIPDSANIMYSLANVYGKMEKYPESERWFLTAMKRDPQNPYIPLNLGVLYHRWGKYQEAEKSYQRSFQLKPDSPVLLENMKLLKPKLKARPKEN